MELKYDSIKFPETDPEHINSVNRLYKMLLSKRVFSVEPSRNPITPRVLWMIQSYIQLTIHRAIDLFDILSTAWADSKPSVAFVLTRAVVENAAAMYDLYDRLDSQLRVDEVKGIHEIIFVRLMGGRDKESPPIIPNILGAIDKTDERYEGFRPSYDLLSEFAHPNYSGMHGLYGKVDRETVTLYIDGSRGINDATFSFILFPLHLSLRVLLDSIHKIESLYPAIWYLSDKEENES
jgi:hypothetical protein